MHSYERLLQLTFLKNFFWNVFYIYGLLSWLRSVRYVRWVSCISCVPCAAKRALRWMKTMQTLRSIFQIACDDKVVRLRAPARARNSHSVQNFALIMMCVTCPSVCPYVRCRLGPNVDVGFTQII